MKLFSLHLRDITCFFFATLVSMFFLSTTQVYGSWSTGGPYGGYINCMAMAPDPDVIYAGTEGGVFKSVDGGHTWTVTGFPQIPVRAIQVAPVGLCQTINFDDVTAPCSFDEITALRDEYSTWGVVFNGPGGNDGGAVLDKCYSFEPEGQSLPNYLAFDRYETFSDGGVPQWPETISFSQPTSFVKVSATQTVSTVTMTAYDASDNLIDSDSLKPVFWSFTPMSVAGANIAKVVIDVTDPGGTPFYSLLLDDLAFTRQPAGLQPDVVYAGTDDGIYKSEDGGNTWTHKGLSGARVNAVAVDPTNPCILYAGTGTSNSGNGKVFKSMDGGETWQVKLSETGLDAVLALLVDTDNPSYIYAGVNNDGAGIHGAGLRKSTDGGDTWVSRRVFPYTWDKVVALSMTSAGSNPAVIYALSNPGYSPDVYKSTTWGESWTATNTPNLPVNPPWALAVDPSNPNVLYVATRDAQGGHISKSTDGAGTWSIKAEGLPRSYTVSIVIDPRNGDVVYAGLSDDGVYQSTDGAESWNNVNEGMSNTYIEDLALHPTAANTVLAAMKKRGNAEYVAKTTTGGSSWGYLANPPAPLGAVAFDPQDPDIIWGGDYFHKDDFFHLYKSTDSGNSWTTKTFLICYPGTCETGVSQILINKNDSDNMLVGTSGLQGVFGRTTDGGENWEMLGLPTSTLALDPNQAGVLYRGKEAIGQVIRYSDVWENWTNEEITPDGGIGDVRDIEVDSNSRVYVAASDGLWRWDGSDWTTLSGLPTDDITALAIDRSTNPERVYVGTGQAGVFVSHDGGITWVAFNEGLGVLSIRKLAISASQPTMLYAGTLYGGVWSTAIQADTDNDGLPDDLESQMCTDPNDADTDDDGLPDGVEDANQNGVVDTGETDPCKADTDGDTMPDGWEIDNGLDPLINDATGDPDEDLLDNSGEFTNDTDPNNPDTDSDKMPDGWEVLNNLDPLVDDALGDADEDGSTNLLEYQRGTDPNDPNSYPSKAMPWLPLLLDEDGTVIVSEIVPGTWAVSTDFGTLEFIVNDSSTGITKVTYHFSDYSCGGVPFSGTLGVSNPTSWPITNRQFTIETLLPPLTGDHQMTISGTFDGTGKKASGTWEVSVPEDTCAGTWEEAAPSF